MDNRGSLASMLPKNVRLGSHSLLLAICLTASPVFAQTMSSTTATLTESAATSEAWDIYHRGTMNLAVGDLDKARSLFQSLANSDSALKNDAQEILDILAGPAGLSKVLDREIKLAEPPETTEPFKYLTESESTFPMKEKPSGLARGLLVAGQISHGIVLGLELCGLAECEDSRAFIGSVVAGAGVGLAGSLFYKSEAGITAGESSALNSGTLWGAWFTTTFIAGSGAHLTANQTLGTYMLGQTIGTIGGGLYYRVFEPTAGEVSMVNSAGIWSGALGGLALSIIGVDGQTSFWLPMFVITHGTAAVTAAFARDYSMSRGRVLLIDGSGVLGGLLGLGVLVMALGDSAVAEVYQVGTGLGIVGGLAVGTLLTAGFDVPDVNASVAMVPTEGGGIMMLGAQF